MTVEITQEERNTIDNLIAMTGADENSVVEAFLMADRDADLAANM